MNHLAKIQSEFLKEARKWDDLTLEEQRGYLQRHPKSKRRLTAKPESQVTSPTPYHGSNLQLKKKFELRQQEARNQLQEGNVIAINQGGRKRYLKLDENGKLWSSEYENTVWRLDNTTQISEAADGFEVIGPQLQTFSKDKTNTYFKTTKPVVGWVMTGWQPSNASYGAARISKPVWNRQILSSGTKVEILAGGDFIVSEQYGEMKATGEKLAFVRFTDPRADPGVFEKQYGIDYSKTQLPLSAMVETTPTGSIIGSPKTLNIPKLEPTQQEMTRFSDLGDLSFLDTKLTDKGYLKVQKKNNPTNHLTIYAKGGGYGINVTSGSIENPSKALGSTWWDLGNKAHTAEEVLKTFNGYGLTKEQYEKDEAYKHTTEVVKKNEEKIKEPDFPADKIAEGLKHLPFRQSSDHDINKEDDIVSASIRHLGVWNSRPGEEDDDFPSWDEASAEKYTKLFKEWAVRQPWFNPEIMRATVETSEKAYADFNIVKRDLKREKSRKKYLKLSVKDALRRKNNEPVDQDEQTILGALGKKLREKYGVVPSAYYAEQLLRKRHDGTWAIDHDEYEKAMKRLEYS